MIKTALAATISNGDILLSLSTLTDTKDALLSFISGVDTLLGRAVIRADIDAHCFDGRIVVTLKTLGGEGECFSLRPDRIPDHFARLSIKPYHSTSWSCLKCGNDHRGDTCADVVIMTQSLDNRLVPGSTLITLSTREHTIEEYLAEADNLSFYSSYGWEHNFRLGDLLSMDKTSSDKGYERWVVQTRATSPYCVRNLYTLVCYKMAPRPDVVFKVSRFGLDISD